MQAIRVFFLVFFVCVAFMYFVYFKRGKDPLLFPGDIYRIRNERAYYFPLGSALVLTVLLYLFVTIIF